MDVFNVVVGVVSIISFLVSLKARSDVAKLKLQVSTSGAGRDQKQKIKGDGNTQVGGDNDRRG